MVVASYGDLRRVANGLRPVALSEHGVGQTYGNQHPSYCGGVSAERRQVGLFLVPNAAAAEANRRVQPDAAIAVVGVPRLDRFVTRPAAPEPGSPLVALSFHWPCAVAPETRGAFPHYRAALPELARHFRLLGHGHPRVLDRLARGYQRLGIPVAADFEEVLARASLYVADNSSTLYEFAAAGRPVVVLNAPWFRRHVEHGLRFWRYADVGVQCDRPEDLVAAVRRALDDPPEQELRRRRAVDAVVPLRDGRSAARAADALRAWLGWPARAAEEARA
jgi:glycosyltransferase involved in cell wall biosynthesis